jgi:hypothetical protein
MVIFRCSVKILTRRARRKIRNGGRTLGVTKLHHYEIKHFCIQIHVDLHSIWFGLRPVLNNLGKKSLTHRSNPDE